MSATVRDLVGIRSALAESIKCYYETVIREMDRTPWSHDNQSPVTVSDVAVAVRVRKKVKQPTRLPLAVARAIRQSANSTADDVQSGRHCRALVLQKWVFT